MANERDHVESNTSAQAEELADAAIREAAAEIRTERVRSQTTTHQCDPISQAAAGVGEAVDNVVKTGQAALESAGVVTEAIATVASQAGEVAIASANEAAIAATKQAQQLFDQATMEAGKALSFIGDNPVLQQVLKFFRADWLLGLAGNVDIVKARTAVEKLQQEHPNESPGEIAHRIIVDKAIYAGGIGFASSILPGVAVALLAIDLAATTALQAEMIYQIAAAYGMDLKDPARRGEVLAIFGLSLGGSEAVKAGFGLLRNLPLAGMAIGASTNAIIMYTVGYAASRFYEAKANPMTSQAAAEALRQESRDYLEVAIAQRGIMDQILVHMILASYPDKSWSDIVPELRSLNLTPASVDAIAADIVSPQPLDHLLNQLNPEFAMPVLAQCYRIARLDGVTTEAEARVMSAIANQFNLEMSEIEAMVQSDAIAR